MKAAIVVEAGKTPIYGDFQEPVPASGEVRVAVYAAALSNLVKGRASGEHYSSSGQPPFVVGVDGVGRLDDGRRVYFALPKTPFGSMSERTVIPPSQCVSCCRTIWTMSPPPPSEIPACRHGLRQRARQAGGGGNRPGKWSDRHGGPSGRSDRQIYGRTKGCGDRQKCGSSEGAVCLGGRCDYPTRRRGDAFEDALKEQFGGEGIDVVLDYLWGPSAERIIIAGAKAGKDAVPIRFVHVGSMSAASITLHGAALRSSAITLMGSGIGSVPLDGMVKSIGELMRAATPGGLQNCDQNRSASE